MKNLNSGCGVDFQYFINGLYLFCFCDIFILSFLFLISVNRSFIRFHGNTSGNVFLGFLHYCIANIVFVVFKITICLVVWICDIEALRFEHGTLLLCLGVFTTRLQ